MAILSLNGISFDADLAIFDKDGTLLDFDSLWGLKAAGCLARLAAQLDDDALAPRLLRAIGYDPDTRKTASNSALAVAPLSRINQVIISELVRAGFPGDRVQRAVDEIVTPCLEAVPGEEMVRPLGDVRGLFQKIHARAIRPAIVTSDDRKPTLHAMALLGLDGLVAGLVCADDPIEQKPNPAAVFHLCSQLNAVPSRTMVVGDNPSDLRMGRAAGAGLNVGVLSGNSGRADLQAHADVIIESIDAIEVP